jgi:transposase
VIAPSLIDVGRYVATEHANASASDSCIHSLCSWQNIREQTARERDVSDVDDTLPSIALRLKAGQMLLAGNSVSAIASALSLSRLTVTRYKGLVDRGGLAALETMRVGGRRSVLDAEAKKWLDAALGRSPRNYGFEVEQWSIGRVGKLIEKQFGVTFSRIYVRQLIINLGHHDKLKPVSFARSPGAASPLNDVLWSWLTAALKESPRLSGIEADRWTNAHVRTVIQRRTGVMYSRTHIWTLMSRHGLQTHLRKS